MPKNASVTLPVTVATAGVYQVAVGARGQFDDKMITTQVATGTSPGSQLTTPLGKASTAFKSVIVGNYAMTAGINTITLTNPGGYADIDYVNITPTTNVVTAARAGAEAQKALSAYPNPTNGQALNVSLELASAQETTFDLVNALGQRVSTATRSLRAGSNQLQLPTTGVAGGMYQLVVRSGDQPTLVQRVVVN
ncbi:MAG: T9SS type A sorting domain-containing protein [Hymenobacter sp.]